VHEGGWHEYVVVAITEGMGYTLPSEPVVIEDGPVTFGKDSYNEIVPEPLEGAYQFLLYGRSDPSDRFRYYQAIIAQPFGGRARYRRQIIFRDRLGSGREDLNPRVILIPLEIPSEALEIDPDDPKAERYRRNNSLRTRIERLVDGQVILRDAAETSVTGEMIAHDNSLLLDAAINQSDASRIFVPIGRYPIYGNVWVTKPVHVEAEFTAVRTTTTLNFKSGYGMEVRARHCIFENLLFHGEGGRPQSGSVPKSPPAGGSFISNDGIHGAGVLVLYKSSWINCSFDQFAGSGHAIWGWEHASHTNVEKCYSNKNWGHGFYVSSGDDANDCVWYRCSAVGNGGWGIYDSGALGNHMYGCHVSANLTGAYFVEDNNAYSTIIGCYSEGGQPPSKTNRMAVVVGGDHGAGFTDDTTGLLLLHRRSVSPFRITDRVKPDGPYKDLNINKHYAIDFGEGSGSPSKNIGLLGFSSIFEALAHHISFLREEPREGQDRPFLRLRFWTGKSGVNAESMEWAQGDIRGPGIIAFPQGFLLRPERRRATRQLERKVAGWNGPYPPQTPGTYEPGDVMVDLSGTNYFYFPRSPFGRAGEWRANKAYQIGNVVRPSGTEEGADVYVVKAFYDGSITYVSREYDLQFLPGLTSESAIPNAGNGLVIVAEVGELLYFRAFGFADDDLILSFREEDVVLEERQARELERLKRRLERLREVAEISYTDRKKIISSVQAVTRVKFPPPSPFFRFSGSSEPDWRGAPDPNEIKDGEVVWKRWGSGEPDFETLGRRAFRETVSVRVAAHGSSDIRIRRRPRIGIDIGDTVVVTPEQLPPPGITWQGLVTGRDEVTLRLANVSSEPVPPEGEPPVEITWTIDCWKH
jgi:hypothetical protein